MYIIMHLFLLLAQPCYVFKMDRRNSVEIGSQLQTPISGNLTLPRHAPQHFHQIIQGVH